MADNESGAAMGEYSPFAGNFVVILDGDDDGHFEKVVGSFQEVSGLSAEVDVEELVEGGNNGYVHKLPGRISWPNIVLKRGVVQADVLFHWFLAASEHGLASTDGATRSSGTLTRWTASIALRDPAGGPVRSWDLQGAFPVRWTGPTLAATASDIAAEELEVAHHGFSSVS